jgi:hypothetical protein
MHISTYLAITLRRLSGEDWSQRIFPHLSGNYLVRYQACVREEHWRELWDLLLKPFNAQRSEYRRIHNTHRAPDIFFGVKAKTCQPEAMPIPDVGKSEKDMSTDASEGKREDDTTIASDGKPDDSSDSKRDDSSDGIPLPGAPEWLEFWNHTEIPTQRTFIEFASNLSQTLPRRSTSEPDLSRLVDGKDS